MKTSMKKIALLLSLVLCVSLLAACSAGGASGQSAGNVPANTVFSIDDLPGKVIGVQESTTGDIYASDYEEEGSTIERYSKGNDAIQALKQGKVDCVIIDNQPALAFVEGNDDLMILEEPFALEYYGIAIAKENTELKDAINGALAELKADGTLDKIIDGYISGGDYKYASTASDYPNGELTMATNAFFPPYEYYDGGKIVGIDPDIATAICDKLGYKLVIEDMEFNAIITAVQSGKSDFGMAGMTETEDRLVNVDFSDSYTTATQVIVVRKK